MNIYKKIENELIETPNYVHEPIKALFRSCQEYYRYYKINENTQEAQDTLQNYLDDDFLLAGRMTERPKRKKSMNISSKLYIEYIWQVYKDIYAEKWRELTEKKFFKEIVGGSKEKIAELLQSEIESSLVLCIDSSIKIWINEYQNCNKLENLNLENLHRAMTCIEKEINSVMPDVEESVEDLIAPQILSDILYLLKEKNYPACIFLVAPITRTLTTGAVTKYTPKKENKTVYFTEKLLYNLDELKKRMEGLQELLDAYIETKMDLQEC